MSNTNGIGTEQYMGESYQERLKKITDKNAANAFQVAYANKMAGSTDYVSNISKIYNTGKVGATNFADAFPQYNVITHVGNANISSANWQRNDFPFWEYFQKNTSADALNDWKPVGANPPQTRGDLQRNYSSVGSGQIAILIPEKLQQKMDADPAYARQIMAKVQEWKEDYDRWDNTVAASYGMNVAEQQAGKSYVFDLDENGDVRNCTVTAPGRITGPTKEEQEQFEAEQAEKRRRRVKYIQILENSALRRKMQEQENLRLCQSQLASGTKNTVLTLHISNEEDGQSIGAMADYNSSVTVYRTKDFDMENPVYKVKIWDANGNVTERMVDISKVDPKNCDKIDMFAYSSHLTATGECPDAQSAFIGAKPDYNSKNGVSSLFDKRNWLDIVKDMMQMQYDAGNIKGYWYYKGFWDFLNQ